MAQHLPGILPGSCFFFVDPSSAHAGRVQPGCSPKKSAAYSGPWVFSMLSSLQHASQSKTVFFKPLCTAGSSAGSLILLPPFLCQFVAANVQLTSCHAVAGSNAAGSACRLSAAGARWAVAAGLAADTRQAATIHVGSDSSIMLPSPSLSLCCSSCSIRYSPGPASSTSWSPRCPNIGR